MSAGSTMIPERERNWGAEPWRAPDLMDGDELVADEPGRVLPSSFRQKQMVCYRAYYLRLVHRGLGGYSILVKHGAGEERLNLSTAFHLMVPGLMAMKSDERYAVLFSMYDAAARARRAEAEIIAHRYISAFAEGRLKKRKKRGRERVDVWIEPPAAAA